MLSPGTFTELRIDRQLTVVAMWIVMATLLSMVAVDGLLGFPLGVLVGVVVASVVAWATAVVLGE